MKAPSMEHVSGWWPVSWSSIWESFFIPNMEMEGYTTFFQRWDGSEVYVG